MNLYEITFKSYSTKCNEDGVLAYLLSKSEKTNI